MHGNHAISPSCTCPLHSSPSLSYSWITDALCLPPNNSSKSRAWVSKGLHGHSARRSRFFNHIMQVEMVVAVATIMQTLVLSTKLHENVTMKTEKWAITHNANDVAWSPIRTAEQTTRPPRPENFPIRLERQILSTRIRRALEPTRAILEFCRPVQEPPQTIYPSNTRPFRAVLDPYSTVLCLYSILTRPMPD